MEQELFSTVRLPAEAETYRIQTVALGEKFVFKFFMNGFISHLFILIYFKSYLNY